MTAPDRHALVLGASGLIGRHLVLALHQAGVRVSTANRSPAAHRRLTHWLAEREVHRPPPDLRVDYTRPTLIAGECDDITEVHNCAGAYRFGMSEDEARRANVDTVRAVVAFAARLPRLRRLVHVSGYRVGGQGDPVDLSAERRRRAYRTLGAYEASKVEADTVFRAEAERLGLPWSVVNPSSVIGDSRTGATDQYLGLAQSLKDLWQGTLPALPGNAHTFVPVVAADHLARFMTLLPTDPATARAAYWPLADDTPPLPELLTLVADHYRVRAPRARVPVPLLRRLPRRLTGADPETLTFLSSDRYPTASAHALAARHQLTPPDTTTTILRWADHLAAHRFGHAPAGDRRFTTPGGVRTFQLGAPQAPTVLLPGLPVNADTWAPVVAELGHARALDLPGLGMSAGGETDWPAWTAALTGEAGATHLVGHSLGAAAAVEAAAAHPDAVHRLTLVAPFFLQPSPTRPSGWAPVSRWYLSRVSAEALAQRLTGTTAHADALRSSVTDLRRGTAATAARLLAATARPRWRAALRAALRRHPGPVHVIVGANDPLTPDGHALLDALPHATVTTLDGAGHHPQLTHPRQLADAITAPADTPAPPPRAAPTPSHRPPA
ncbi:alpha/beta fold hydrolase [Streptomyces sp. DSM 44915]|uniref:Alpha/beta fold hydrolase n=1 Tax=Streptomyces chisholmiae TaxID=3075540 RepID=A0ABU2JRU2_9ACTN|nr:alpha/beta fold hydrolase [Streptomyces sp. DSM 44915]MDT0267433.1 alpha/beta fold hydrolase [Streptomyces sp. DSM 44915]